MYIIGNCLLVFLLIVGSGRLLNYFKPTLTKLELLNGTGLSFALMTIVINILLRLL